MQPTINELIEAEIGKFKENFPSKEQVIIFEDCTWDFTELIDEKLRLSLTTIAKVVVAEAKGCVTDLADKSGNEQYWTGHYETRHQSLTNLDNLANSLEKKV